MNPGNYRQNYRAQRKEPSRLGKLATIAFFTVVPLGLAKMAVNNFAKQREPTKTECGYVNNVAQDNTGETPFTYIIGQSPGKKILGPIEEMNMVQLTSQKYLQINSNEYTCFNYIPEGEMRGRITETYDPNDSTSQATAQQTRPEQH